MVRNRFQLCLVQMISDQSNDDDLEKGKMDFDTAVSSLQGIAAKVQIDTLSAFIGFGGGIYKMAAVKRVKALPDFLDMSVEDRGCEVESEQECKTRRLVNQCGCVPWEVADIQVIFKSSPGLKIHINLQSMINLLGRPHLLSKRQGLHQRQDH